MPSFLILALLSALCAVASACCAWTVYRYRLINIYPAVFAYLALQTFLFAAGGVMGLGSPAYAWVFLFGYLTTLVIDGLIVRSLFNEVFAGYKGIADSARWSIRISVAVAVIGAVVSRLATQEALATKRSLLIGLQFAGRSLVFGFAILLLCVVLALCRYPIKVSQNVLVNLGCFTALLLLEVATMLADQMMGLRHTAWVNESIAVLNVGCLVLWTSLLAREELAEKRAVRPPSRQNDEARLLRELHSMSDILLGFGRK